jgi:hypothetical protein
MYNRVIAFIEGNGVLTEAQHVIGQENQWKQPYRFLLKVCRKQLKKINPIGII